MSYGIDIVYEYQILKLVPSKLINAMLPSLGKDRVCFLASV